MPNYDIKTNYNKVTVKCAGKKMENDLTVEFQGSGGGGEGATIATSGGFKGTAIPYITDTIYEDTDFYVYDLPTVYLNTNSDPQEFINYYVDLVDKGKITFLDDTYCLVAFLVSITEESEFALVLYDVGGAYVLQNLYESLTYYFAYSSGTNEDITNEVIKEELGFVGWNPEYVDGIQINAELTYGVAESYISNNNELLKDYISATPFVKSVAETIQLSGEYDGSPMTFKNEWVGGDPIPVEEYVEKIYINKELWDNTSELYNIVSSLNFYSSDEPTYFAFADNAENPTTYIALVAAADGEIFYIIIAYDDEINYILFNKETIYINDTLKELDYIEIKATSISKVTVDDTTFSIGNQNDKLIRLFSIDSFEEGGLEYKTTDKIDLRELIKNDKKIPLDINVNYTEGTLDVQENGITNVKYYENVNVDIRAKPKTFETYDDFSEYVEDYAKDGEIVEYVGYDVGLCRRYCVDAPSGTQNSQVWVGDKLYYANPPSSTTTKAKIQVYSLKEGILANVSDESYEIPYYNNVSLANVGNYIYVFGLSSDDTSYNKIYRLNLETGEGESLTPTGDALESTINVTIATKGTDIYLIGGQTSDGTELESFRKYDTLTNTISNITLSGNQADILSPISEQTAVVYGDYIYFFGKDSYIRQFNTSTTELYFITALGAGTVKISYVVQVDAKVYLFRKDMYLSTFDLTEHFVENIELPNPISVVSAFYYEDTYANKMFYVIGERINTYLYYLYKLYLDTIVEKYDVLSENDFMASYSSYNKLIKYDNDKYYYFGYLKKGSGYNNNYIVEYNTNTFETKQVAQITQSSYLNHAFLYNGLFYLFGGSDSSTYYLKTFNPITNEILDISTEFPTDISFGANSICTVSIENNFFFFMYGTGTIYKYNAIENTFTKMETKISDVTHVHKFGDKIFVAAAGTYVLSRDYAYIYDPSTDTYEYINLPKGFTIGRSTEIINYDDTTLFALQVYDSETKAQLYSMETNTLLKTQRLNMSIVVYDSQMFIKNDSVYAILTSEYKNYYLFDLNKNFWESENMTVPVGEDYVGYLYLSEHKKFFGGRKWDSNTSAYIYNKDIYTIVYDYDSNVRFQTTNEGNFVDLYDSAYEKTLYIEKLSNFTEMPDLAFALVQYNSSNNCYYIFNGVDGKIYRLRVTYSDGSHTYSWTLLEDTFDTTTSHISLDDTREGTKYINFYVGKTKYIFNPSTEKIISKITYDASLAENYKYYLEENIVSNISKYREEFAVIFGNSSNTIQTKEGRILNKKLPFQYVDYPIGVIKKSIYADTSGSSYILFILDNVNNGNLGNRKIAVLYIDDISSLFSCYYKAQDNEAIYIGMAGEN